MQLAHAKYDSDFIVVHKKGAQQRSFIEMQEILEHVAWVVIRKMDVVEMDDHTAA